MTCEIHKDCPDCVAAAHAREVERLRKAREKKKILTGKKTVGRKNYMERDPTLVSQAKIIYGRTLSYRKTSEELARKGYLNSSFKTYAPTAIKRMVSYEE